MIEDNLSQAEKWLHETELQTAQMKPVRKLVPHDFADKYELEYLEEKYGVPDKLDETDEGYGTAYYWEEEDE